MTNRGYEQGRENTQRGEHDVRSQRDMQGSYGWNDPRGDERMWQGRDERGWQNRDERSGHNRDERGGFGYEDRQGYGQEERGGRSFGGGFDRGFESQNRQGRGYGEENQFGYGREGRGFVGGGYGDRGYGMGNWGQSSSRNQTYGSQLGAFGNQDRQGYGNQSDWRNEGYDQRYGGPDYRSGYRGQFAGQYGNEGFGSRQDEQRGGWGGYGAEPGFGNQQRGFGRGVGMMDQGFEQRGFGRPVSRGRAPKSYRRSDERIKEDIHDRLMHGWINAENVEIEVRTGEVTLTGTVEDRQEKHAIEDLAEQVMGVRDVHNQIRVQQEGSMQPSGSQTSTTPTSSSQKKPSA